jgi:hypothetical protein
MKVIAERVSLKRDDTTLCRPSRGCDQTTEIDLQDYAKVAAFPGELPDSDLVYPRGAPLPNRVKYGDQLLQKK